MRQETLCSTLYSDVVFKVHFQSKLFYLQKYREKRIKLLNLQWITSTTLRKEQ